jgi:hypothetical protein
MQVKNLQQAAKDYALRGWHVLPIYPVKEGQCTCLRGADCDRPGKHPLTGHGLDEATTSSALIHKWWHNAPAANVAIRTGMVSDVWVLDADGAEGLAAVAHLEAHYGKLPRTPTVRTGRGGRHYYFRVPNAPAIKNVLKLCGRFLDVRGEDGYVVAPPSNHLTGNPYTWETSPNHADVAEAPAWLVDLVTKKGPWPGAASALPQDEAKQPADATAPETANPAIPAMPSAKRRVLTIQGDMDLETAPGVPEGERHHRALTLVGAHLGRREPAQQVEKKAKAWAARCRPPLPEGEVCRIVADLAAKETKNTAPVADWEAPVPFDDLTLPPFPVDALPDWLRAFVAAEATATQTPPDLAAMLSLSALATACAKKVEILVKEGYVEPLNLFTVVALAPGNRKSAVFTDVTVPLTEYEKVKVTQLKPQVAAAENQLDIKKARLSQVQAKAAKADAHEYPALLKEANDLAKEIANLTIPSLPRLLAMDVTPEKLGSLLFEHEGRMAVLSPEGEVFELMAGRYSSKGTSNFEVYLKGHAGDDLRVDRMSRAPEFVHKPALTLGLAVQPDVIRGLADKPCFRGRGLLGRFLYALPQSLVGRRDPDPPSVPPCVQASYRENLLWLLNLPCPEDGQGDQEPAKLALSPPAYAQWLQFSAWLEPQLDEHGDLGGMADWAGKLAGAVARIAGLLHLADRACEPAPSWQGSVQAPTMERALAIGRYLIPHARAAFALMGADPVVEHAKYVLAWLKRKGVEALTRRDLFEGTKGRFKRVEELVAPLDLLVNHGYLRELALTSHSGPGRKPSPSYGVNPRVHAHNSHDSHNPISLTNSANCAHCATTIAAASVPAAVQNGAHPTPATADSAHRSPDAPPSDVVDPAVNDSVVYEEGTL